MYYVFRNLGGSGLWKCANIQIMLYLWNNGAKFWLVVDETAAAIHWGGQGRMAGVIQVNRPPV